MSDSNEVIPNMHSRYDGHKQEIETKTKRTQLNQLIEKKTENEENN